MCCHFVCCLNTINLRLRLRLRLLLLTQAVSYSSAVATGAKKAAEKRYYSK